MIGFSFRDDHINNLFIDYLTLQKLFIIISPTVEDDIRNNLLKNNKDILDYKNIIKIDNH